MTTTPAGWYPDPENGSRTRWWDGSQWTEHRSEPISSAPPYSPDMATAVLKAPAGTPWNTVWIWLIVLLPLLPMIGLLFIDWESLINASDPTGMSAFAMFADPWYLLSGLGGWVGYGLCAWFAYLDWRELGRRGVPRPFHFAWVFLSSLVYVIGRSVVVRRRTGGGIAPLWAAIGTIVLSIAVASYATVIIIVTTLDAVSQLSFS